MEHAKKMSWTRGQARSVALRYGLAVVSVGAALSLSLAFTHFHLPQPFGTFAVGSSRVDLQACKLEYSIVSPK